ncbi:hypothetical protein C8Q80DRAFT_8426 [Daedaleopsis nitida]|nr:hypothetical protein C8Q80DRAFT_8426 [Daedaleopsis nitida]
MALSFSTTTYSGTLRVFRRPGLHPRYRLLTVGLPYVHSSKIHRREDGPCTWREYPLDSVHEQQKHGSPLQASHAQERRRCGTYTGRCVLARFCPGPANLALRESVLRGHSCSTMARIPRSERLGRDIKMACQHACDICLCRWGTLSLMSIHPPISYAPNLGEIAVSRHRCLLCALFPCRNVFVIGRLLGRGGHTLGFHSDYA